MSSNIIRWVIWTLVSSVILGGTPWRFPAEGEYWIQDGLKSTKARKDFSRGKPLQRKPSLEPKRSTLTFPVDK
mgnify:CR=1 FL=1